MQTRGFRLRAYHLCLIGHHGHRCWQNLTPRDLRKVHAALQQPPDHVHAIFLQGALVLLHAIDEARDPARRLGRLHIGFHELADLLGHHIRGSTQRER